MLIELYNVSERLEERWLLSLFSSAMTFKQKIRLDLMHTDSMSV